MGKEKNKNISIYRKIIAIIFALTIASTSFASCIDCHAFDKNEEVIKLAKTYRYVREYKNNNDAPEIDKWLKNCGVGRGEPYCQAFYVNMWKDLYTMNNLGKSPYPMYAGVARVAEYCINHPFQYKVITTKKMLWTNDKPKQGDLASWKHGKAQFTGFGYKGHAGFVDKIDDKKNIYTVEGNTKEGEGGDQSGTVKGDLRYGHEGVYQRIRTIDIYSNFPIVYFIRLKEKE